MNAYFLGKKRIVTGAQFCWLWRLRLAPRAQRKTRQFTKATRAGARGPMQS
jgi:hypothetical protein